MFTSIRRLATVPAKRRRRSRRGVSRQFAPRTDRGPCPPTTFACLPAHTAEPGNDDRIGGNTPEHDKGEVGRPRSQPAAVVGQRVA
jgi:hypothetical protein